MLELLGLGDPASSRGNEIAILVGPNGSGKSNFLSDLASELRYSRNIAVICNTAYDRFSGMRGIKRLSASRGAQSPKNTVKLAVAHTLDGDDSRFYQMAKILEYCGYVGSIGFKVGMKSQRKSFEPEMFSEEGADPRDIELAIGFLRRFDTREILWVGDRGIFLDYTQGLEFASVLRLEKTLRKRGFLGGIQVYLERSEGPVIELLNASSGELALISSLFFLIANHDQDPVILVDEPENSLHPRWQR